MSKSNIGNSIYDFEFSLTRIITDGKDAAKDKYNFIPISKSIVLYLEVEDNLAKFGCQGRVILNNFYSVLDKAGLGAGINQGVTLFDINFTNLDFDAVKKSTLLDKSFQIITQLGLGDDDSKNSVDKNLTFDFEEYAVSVLRQKKVEPNTLTDNTQLTKLIQTLLATGVDTKQKNLYVQENNFIHKDSLTVPVSQVIKPAQSFYDLISLLYKYLWYSDLKSPGILQLENFIDPSGESIQRSFVLKPLFDLIKDFYTAISNNETDLSRFVTDQFIIGGEAPEPTLRENTIDDYTVSHADLDVLLKTTWANHKAVYLTSDNITDTTTSVVTYEKMRELFNDVLFAGTGGYTVNTPKVPDTIDDKIITHDYVCDFKEGAGTEAIIIAGIKAMMLRSFIFDNSSITFKTLGNPYRKPGMFILLNEDKPSEEAKSAPTGYWFVTSIKHIFDNDIYQNEITAVKFCVRLSQQ
jgi:hypothetical protein